MNADKLVRGMVEQAMWLFELASQEDAPLLDDLINNWLLCCDPTIAAEANELIADLLTARLKKALAETE